MDDKELRRLMADARKVDGNPTFTRRLLNRLPERRRRGGWIGVAVSVAVALLCICGWAYFGLTLGGVADLTLDGVTISGRWTFYAVLLGVTALAVAEVVRQLLKRC